MIDANVSSSFTPHPIVSESPANMRGRPDAGEREDGVDRPDSEKVRYVENSLLLKRQPLEGLYSNLSSYCTHSFLFCHRSASNK